MTENLIRNLVTVEALARFNVHQPHAECRVASPVNLSLSGLSPVDGVAIVAGNRVFATSQTDPAENGIYIAAAGAWVRADDMDSPADFFGSRFRIASGARYARHWFYITSEVETVGTDPVTMFVSETGDDILAAIAELEAQTAAAVAAAGAQTAQALTDFDADASVALSDLQAQAAQAAAGLNFSATIDPDAVNPVGGNGGTYTTIAAALADTIDRASVQLSLRAGAVHPVSEDIFPGDRILRFGRVGSGADPDIAFAAYETGAGNQLYRFKPGRFSQVHFDHVGLIAPAKLNASKGWGVARFWDVPTASQTRIIMEDCRLIGASEFTLMNTGGGSVVSLSANRVTFDGMTGIDYAQGTAVVAHRTTTLLNGGQVAISSGAGGGLLIN
ncbi:hypothetical protein [Loktanella sp. 3ANDIMAR09]|uniref:hypothetical protein n=1 Tax=Loktanella sp. 3ANDIMAR09 TaxID=1225657 RepID=UPI0006F6E2D5|nr:hypothetical protein [Loktanella sp. 3ANDIMAR09]